IVHEEILLKWVTNNVSALRAVVFRFTENAANITLSTNSIFREPTLRTLRYARPKRIVLIQAVPIDTASTVIRRGIAASAVVSALITESLSELSDRVCGA